MTNPIKQLDLAAIEQSQVVRIAGANLTIGGLTSAGVILLVAFAAWRRARGWWLRLLAAAALLLLAYVGSRFALEVVLGRSA